MKRWTKAAGILFLATASVYADRGAQAIAGSQAGAVEPVEPVAAEDPFAEPVTTTVTPDAPAAPVSQPKMNMDGTFTLNIMGGADLAEQLRVIGFQAQRSIIPSKDVRGSLPAMDLYNVTVKEALDAILRVNGFGYREQGNFIYVYTAKELEEMDKAARRTETAVFRVFHVPVADAATMVRPVLSTDAQVSLTPPSASGITTGTGDVGGDSHAGSDVLVINDYPENLERVRTLLKEVDVRPKQILIEATILRAALREDNALGIDFTVLGGVDFRSLTSAGSSAAGALSGLITNSTNPLAQDIVDDGFVAGGTGFTGNVPPGGLRVGVVQNGVGVFLSALEATTDTVVLANPKVLALNKQRGEVIVGRRDGYLTTTVTESSSVQTVEFLDTGTRLIFRPYVSDDGFVRMEIHPEDSSGGLTSANLPFKTTTEVTSNVMVKDGHTIVIGGLFREESSKGRSQVPFLGNLPLAGPLFRSQADRTTREEIIILLTPHIIKDDDAYARWSAEELDQAEKLRVGVRRGMMPIGRERLAESSYDKAVAELNKPEPNRKKALWFLNMATNLNPKFTEAIDLKAQVTGQEVTSVDNSSIRTFLRRMVIQDTKQGVAATDPQAPLATIESVLAAAPPAMAPSTAPSTTAKEAIGATASTDDGVFFPPTPSAAPVESSPAIAPEDDPLFAPTKPSDAPEATPPAPNLNQGPIDLPAPPAMDLSDPQWDAILDQQLKPATAPATAPTTMRLPSAPGAAGPATRPTASAAPRPAAPVGGWGWSSVFGGKSSAGSAATATVDAGDEETIVIPIEPEGSDPNAAPGTTVTGVPVNP